MGSSHRRIEQTDRLGALVRVASVRVVFFKGVKRPGFSSIAAEGSKYSKSSYLLQPYIDTIPRYSIFVHFWNLRVRVQSTSTAWCEASLYQDSQFWCWGDTVYTRGFKYPLFKDSCPKNPTLNGLWDHRPCMLCTWTLWVFEYPKHEAHARSQSVASGLWEDTLLYWMLALRRECSSFLGSILSSLRKHKSYPKRNYIRASG